MRRREQGAPPSAPLVLAVSSGGGHWTQLTRLAPAFEGHPVLWASVHADGLPPPLALPGARYRRLRDATRWDRWGLVVLGGQLLQLMWRERPALVVSTGAAPGLIALAWGRLFGARTVWIDSVANVDELSGCGRWARRVAHEWLTQWPHLAQAGGPAYRGSVW